MVFRTWREVDKLLAEATGPATARQLEIARLTGTPMADDTPRIVAGALLKAALAKELGLPVPRPVSGRYDSRFKILRRRSDPQFAPATEEEAEAWIAHLRLVRRRESLRELAITEGDIIYIIDPERCTECVGSFESSRCAEVCPVDACYPDPERPETADQLIEKWGRLHPGEEPAAETYRA